MVSRYRKRLSGPLLDRIDLHLEVPRVEYEKLAGDGLAEPSEAIRCRVQGARERQWRRFQGTRLTCNAEMAVADIRQHCTVGSTGQSLLRAAMQQLHLSARAYHRVLKVARTIADLAGSDAIQSTHVAEAIQYQPRGQA